jgi:HK97 family phage portal protein
MKNAIGRWLTALGHRLQGKALPQALAQPSYRSSFIDAWRKHREPTDRELLAELKNTAWTCASINAAVCASFPPRLYVKTAPYQPRPKCATKALSHSHSLVLWHKGLAQVEEVTEHPLLSLFQNVNPYQNAFDLWELTQLYLETFGKAYWLLQFDGFLGVPKEIWVLPAQNVVPQRQKDSPLLIDRFEYTQNGRVDCFAPEDVIMFRCPDPRNPYSDGLGPLRACYENIRLTSEYAAMRRQIYENAGIPSAIISPAEVLGEEERDRLEEQWNQKFRRSGAGKVVVAESNLKVDVLSYSMADLAQLAEMKATKEDIANAFHIPLPFLSTETNLANMQAAEHIHKELAIGPRLKRRDQKLNEQLIPLFDPSGRLFVCSEEPSSANRQEEYEQQERDIQNHIRSINEVRAERGLPPVPWGDGPLGMGPQRETNIPTT